MNIPDKAVEAAAKAIYRSADGINADMLYGHEAEWFAKAAVKAAAPYIAAQALRDAADAVEFGYADPRILRVRADELEGGGD